MNAKQKAALKKARLKAHTPEARKKAEATRKRNLEAKERAAAPVPVSLGFPLELIPNKVPPSPRALRLSAQERARKKHSEPDTEVSLLRKLVVLYIQRT